jgi:formylglycine-generating enzyme required for sulfatase activity
LGEVQAQGDLLVQDAVGARGVETKADTRTRVFVSYSRKDMSFADKLEVALRARGFEVLIDREEIYAFEDWWKRIQALIGGADTVVFVLSPDAVKSDVALKEVAHAASLNKRFAPIVCRRVDDAAVPDALRRLNFIFFDDQEQFEASTDRLAEALQTDIAWVRRHTEFGDTAYRWAEAGRLGGMLLRPPVLDQAEAWLAFRPGGAPVPTAETVAFIAQSRKVMLGTQRLWRLMLGSMFTLLVGIILGLVGWINQEYIKQQINWYWTMRPYMLAQVRPYVLTAEAEHALKPLASFRECAKDCPEMIVIPSGEFTMGSPATERGGYDQAERGRYNDNEEGPQHKVTIYRTLAVSKFDVTFADWDACVSVGGCAPAPDSGYGRGTKPAINVSWGDAKQYVMWLSKMTGQPYRLLTEAEWEYAARASTTTAYFWGNEIGKGNGNCFGCGGQWDGRQTSPVGSFTPNQFGLYDMAGNAWQWVQDCWHDDYNGAPTDGSEWTGGDCNYRLIRGGSWDSRPQLLRSAFRSRYTVSIRVSYVGFRVARTLSTGVGAIMVAPSVR